MPEDADQAADVKAEACQTATALLVSRILKYNQQEGCFFSLEKKGKKSKEKKTASQVPLRTHSLSCAVLWKYEDNFRRSEAFQIVWNLLPSSGFTFHKSAHTGRESG